MYADIVFKNGNVVTVDSKNTVAEAVAIKKNSILTVGSNEQINPYINRKTKIIDLKEKSLLPGFIDSHIHLIMIALTKITIDCRRLNIKSLEDLFEKLREKADQTVEGDWIIATNFSEKDMIEKRFPLKSELDGVSKKHPIFVLESGLHKSIINTKTCELAGINHKTPDPSGGEINRDKRGKITGLLIEDAHFRVLQMTRPNDEELIKGISIAQDELLSLGITSLHEAGGYGPEDFRLMQQASQLGVLKTRIWAFVLSLYEPHKVIDLSIKSGMTTGLGDERFKLGPAKVFIDGSSGGPNIATRKPYSHQPDNYGTLFYTQEEINNIFVEAHAKGFQLTAHANGDKAIEMMLNSIETALEKYPKPHRHRIEHAGLTQPDLLERMRELEIIVSPNPGFYPYLGDSYKEFYGERIMHPIKDWLSVNLKPAAGSDAPCVPAYSPLSGIWGATTRIIRGENVYAPSQRINIMDAIRLYTWNGAHASFEENIKGSIEGGKLADLIVLDDHILNVPAYEIKNLSVELTMINGEIVYERNI